jgi:hypothetical protein
MMFRTNLTFLATFATALLYLTAKTVAQKNTANSTTILSTGFEAPEWDLDHSVCGDEFALGGTCNYPVSNVCVPKDHAASQNCCPDDPNEETGWSMSPSSRHCSEPSIRNVHPFAGGQHLRFQYDPAGGSPPGCTGFGTACRQRAHTSQWPPLGPSETTWSYEIAFSGTLGSSLIAFTGEDTGFGSIYLTSLTYFYHLGGVYIYAFDSGAFLFGGYWSADSPDYANYTIVFDPCNNTVTYSYAGITVYVEPYSSMNYQRPLTTDTAYYTTDHYGTTIDIDNHFVTHEPCCGDGVKQSSEECDGADSADCPGECSSECVCDCNGNNLSDTLDLGRGESFDCDVNGMPDECETPDCPAELVAFDVNSGGEFSSAVTATASVTYALVASTGQHGGVGVMFSDDYEMSNGFWHAAFGGLEIPPDAIPDAAGKTRTVSFNVPPPVTASGGPTQTAIRITMVDLENPVPPNNNPAGPCCPPGNFNIFDTAVNAVCTGGADQGYRCPPSACPGSSCSAAVGCTEAAGSNAQGSCARWVGPPLGYLESNDNAGLGNYRAARLQCRPYYHDWSAEPGAGLVNVLGAEVVPSSTYEVRVYAASCKGGENSCLAVSNPVIMTTRRAGDIATPFQGGPPLTQPNAVDVSNAVNKFRNLAGSPPKVISQVQPNFPDPNSDINAIDIVTVVDNVRGFGYTYSGPCVCPSTVPCNVSACAGASACNGLYGAGATCIKTCTSGPRMGQPCNNNLNCGACIGGPATGNGAAGIPCDANADCASGNCGVGVCPTGATPGFCRDRCGRCN